MRWDSMRPIAKESRFYRRKQEQDDGYSIYNDEEAQLSSDDSDGPTAHSLHTLQLIALCIGGFKLSKLCKIFLSNFKYFHSGLPDLLMCRISYKGAPGSINKTTSNLCESFHSHPTNPDMKGLDIKRWLLHQQQQQHVPDAPVVQINDSISSDNCSNNKSINNNDNIDVNDMLNKDDMNEPDLDIYDDSLMKIIEEATPDRDFPADDINIQLLEDIHHSLCFDCILLEVKSPLDVLSNKQIVWLEMLNSIDISAYVCRVLES